MKKTNFIKTVLLLCALVVGSSSVWAVDTLVETIDFTSANEDRPSISAYGTTSTWGNWSIVGAANNSKGWSYLRIGGGKNNSSPSTITRTTSGISKAIDYIEINHEASSSSKFSISSIVAEASNSTDFSEPTATKTVSNPSISTSGTIKIEFDSQVAANSYYKITINWSNSGSSNAGLNTDNVKFYQKASSDPSSDAHFTNTTPSINFPGTTTYTQAATTAQGYTGTVTYSITANTAGASIEGSTVTVTQEGSVTVKATAPAITGWAESEATYTLTVTDTRTDSGLEYDEDSQTVGMGSILTAPTLTNPHNLAVTYSSDDTSIATVDEDGNVTGVAMGSTTITASFAGNSTYKAGSASYTLTVTRVAAANSIWYESFDDNDQTGGNDGTWSNISSTPTPDFDLTGWTYDKAYGASQCVRTGKGGYLTSPAIGVAGNVTLTFKMESWGTDTGYGYVDIVGDGTFEDEETRATLSLNKSNTWKNFTLKLIGVTEETKVKFFHTDANKRLFIDEVEVFLDKQAVTVTEAGYATFVSDYDLDYSGLGVKAYRATVSGTAITFEKVTTVPAGEGVLLDGAGNFQVPVATGVDAWDEDYNVFVRGTGAAVATDNGDGKYNYILNKVNDEVGFYKANGQTVATNRAYLQTTTEQARIALFFDDDETTGINAMLMNNERMNNEVYNLNGQRVAQPTKGLYIMNGKKVVIK